MTINILFIFILMSEQERSLISKDLATGIKFKDRQWQF